MSRDFNIDIVVGDECPTPIKWGAHRSYVIRRVKDEIADIEQRAAVYKTETEKLLNLWAKRVLGQSFSPTATIGDFIACIEGKYNASQRALRQVCENQATRDLEQQIEIADLKHALEKSQRIQGAH